MSTQPVNSVMKLTIPADLSSGVDPRVRGYIEELRNAIMQLQSYIEQYAGFTQKISGDWASLRAVDTLLEHQLNRYYLMAGEAIAEGAMISIYDSGSGVLKFRNANATGNTKPAHGICSTTGGITSGAYGESILQRCLCSSISGLTIGTRYFLSTTNGLIVGAEPAGAGNIGQYIGYALSSSILLMDINMQFVQH